MAIDLNQIILRMSANTRVVAALLDDVTAEQAHWKPDDASWSLLEVICHLGDEEREDFRTRVDVTLHQPDTPWPPIDPTGWVTSRKYAERDLAASLQAWLAERDTSLAWLCSLANPDWHTSRPRPRGGTISAGDVMAAWLAHDFLHIRQMNELHYAWHKLQSQSFGVDYAGDW